MNVYQLNTNQHLKIAFYSFKSFIYLFKTLLYPQNGSLKIPFDISMKNKLAKTWLPQGQENQ